MEEDWMDEDHELNVNSQPVQVEPKGTVEGTWSPSYISAVIMEQDLHEDEIDVEEDEIDVKHEYDSDELDRDDMLRNRDGVVNFVWDGWDAALIVSKREKAQTRKRKWFEVSSAEGSHESDTITVSQPDQNMKEVNESTEDLERIYNLNEISNEYEAFYSNVSRSKCDPFVAVAERRVEVDKFSTLREHDVCDVIQQHENRSKYTFFEVSPWAFPHNYIAVAFEDVSESDVSIAMMELDNYVPLQADREIQFTLELARRKSFLVTDTLIFESLMGIKISDSDFCPTSPDESAPFDPQKVAFVREQLIDAIMYGWSCLLQLKQMAFDYFQEAVSFPLLHGSFGRPCTDELIEVIKIADYERGMRRQHFISVQHILFGLSLSRVGDIVRQGIFDNIELRSDLPMLGIYKLSSDAAKFLDDAKVGLEHFVFAILYGKQEKDGKALEEHSSLVLDYEACDTQLLDSLRKSATNCGVESFEDRDIAGEFITPDERDGNIVTCTLTVVLKRLNKALSEGMKLPLIREKV